MQPVSSPLVSTLYAGSIPQAKLSPPRPSTAQVPRAVMQARLQEALRARLVLVRAPAGFGKTTAMQQLRTQYESAGIATAWLTLDAADNDVSRLLHCMGSAVRALDAQAGTASDLFGVLNALARDNLPFALFLDDFEVLQSDAVMGLVRQFAEQLPACGRLVIGSRAMPEMGLGRMRARGQLLEIDAAALRFTEDEASEFFRLRGCALPPKAMAQLLDKTEGWISALWLASLALEKRGQYREFVERFSGTDQAVAEYLAEDVLAQQSEEVRDFLLRTSILRTLDPRVCEALVPRCDCAAMLGRLDAENLFLTPLSGDNGSYRYHSLFADFLRAQLAREQPREVARLHLAASGWYESQARPVPAIEHALEGGDFPHALHLLREHAEHLLEQGRMRLLSRWFAAIPAELLVDEPLLQVAAVYAECFTRGAWQAQQRLDRSPAQHSADASVQAHLNALRPLLLATMDRVEEALPAGRAALMHVPSCRPFADSTLANAMAFVVSVMGDAREAYALLDAAHGTQDGSIFSRMYSESVQGVLDQSEGRLRQAAARFRVALAATPRAASYNPTNGNAWAGVLHAGVLYESNDLDVADHLLNVYLPLARDAGLPDHVIVSYRMRARIAFLRGDVDSAFGLLTELEFLGHDRQLPRVTASARLEQARIFTLQGNGQAAADALQRADDPAVWPRIERLRFAAHEVEDIAIGRLRWRLRFGHGLGELERDLAAHVTQAQASGRRHRELKLRLLSALALARNGRHGESLEALSGVLHHTAQEGFMRLLLDEGALLAPLLRRFQRDARCARDAGPIIVDHVAQLLEALDRSGELIEPEEPPDAADAGAVDAPPVLVDPLSRKELKVLELVASGYSNAAMAERLFVSESTVRTHLRSINVKLGARSRTQAVALARRLGVVR